MPSYQFKLNGQPIRGGAKVTGTGPAVLSCVSDHPIAWWSINWDGGDSDGNNISSVKIGPNEWRYEQTLTPGTYSVRCSNQGTPEVPGGTEGGWINFEYALGEQPVQTTWPPLGIVGNRATIENKTIQTVRGGPKGAEIMGDGVTLRNVAFTTDGGYLIKANGEGLLIDGLTAGTFWDYAVYLEGARNANLRRLRITGGSTNESILRLADVDGVLIEDAVIDYTASPRKATLRGWGKNIIVRNSRFNGRNSTIGLTPMSYDDGGSGFIAGGYLYINRAPYLVTVDNKADWMAAVRVSIAAGRREHADILADVLNRVPVRVKISGTVVTIPVSEVDQGKTVRERVKNVGQRAEAKFENCEFIDAPIRNSAGGNQQYIGCTFKLSAGVEPFTGWNENVYPSADLALPKDEPRPFPVTVFDRCTFEVASWTRAQFLKFVADNRIRLISCSFNGVQITEATS